MSAGLGGSRAAAALSAALVVGWPVPGRAASDDRGVLLVRVTAAGGPVAGAEVRAGAARAMTDARGEARLELAAGSVAVQVSQPGFAPATAQAVVVAGSERMLELELPGEARFEEEVVVSATRTDKRVQDEPIRVEVVDQEEVDEKLLMTPGDVAMLLNETSGLRVQVTSPSLGAASVRIQGLRGRYGQVLSDGLPLYGGQAGSFGPLQIPPMDLKQVEVIKGVASALYGGSALAGVINLVSRPPRDEPEGDALVNRSSRGATDGVVWLAGPLGRRWRGSLLLLASHVFLWSTEADPERAGRREAALNPRHAAGVDLMWERAGRGRIGLELFYTGRQRLEENAYRARSEPYLLWGFLADWRFGRVRAYVNTENLSDVRQTRHDPLLRPERAADGRWTVDA